MTTATVVCTSIPVLYCTVLPTACISLLRPGRGVYHWGPGSLVAHIVLNKGKGGDKLYVYIAAYGYLSVAESDGYRPQTTYPTASPSASGLPYSPFISSLLYFPPFSFQHCRASLGPFCFFFFFYPPVCPIPRQQSSPFFFSPPPPLPSLLLPSSTSLVIELVARNDRACLICCLTPQRVSAERLIRAS